jgi:hypothetical protein
MLSARKGTTDQGKAQISREANGSTQQNRSTDPKCVLLLLQVDRVIVLGLVTAIAVNQIGQGTSFRSE